MPIAFTPGEPSGIGPDIAIIYAQKKQKEDLLVYCDPDILIDRAKKLNLPITLKESKSKNASELSVYPIKTNNIVFPGRLDPANSNYVLETIKHATKDCLNGNCDGLLTGPVNKGVINESGIEFTGHTEFLAKLTETRKTVMLLTTDQLKVALATTHVPLTEVSKNITRESLTQVISIINDNFKYLGVNKPKILVCGLNPHAGENGYLGNEEKTIISPIIKDLNKVGYDLIGPVPADTAFTHESLKNIDVVLAMYHDQGLPVLKAQGFKKAANITLGLPFFRTSVDHGTAIELAGTGNISLGSFNTALSYFKTLTDNVIPT